jgi:hypothetical protein
VMILKAVVDHWLLVLPGESLASVQDADLIRALASLSVEQVRPSIPHISTSKVCPGKGVVKDSQISDVLCFGTRY